VSSLIAGRAALAGAVIALVLGAVLAGTAGAATLGISLTGCGTANNGFQFTINGFGFAGYAGLDVQVTSSEVGAVPNPNYVLAPTAPPNPFVGAIAPLNSDGSFTFNYNAAAGQQLPATVGIYTIDDFGNPQTLLYSTTVTAATACTDQSNLGSARTLLPTVKEQCQNWALYGIFKNAGDCGSYLSTVARNQPALLP
jgi:hypothetical protein